MAINFVNTTRESFLEEHKRVYRFMTLDRFVEILKTKKIALVNPSEWEDPFEKYFLDREYIIDNERFNLPIKDKVFAMCVSGTINSEAFWKVYAPKGNGIRLTFNTEKLLTNFLDNIYNADVYIGNVCYQFTKKFYDLPFDKKVLIDEIKNDKIGRQQIELLLKKRTSFLYEDEVRIMVIPQKNSKDTSIFLTPTEIASYTEECNLDPRLGKYHAEVLKEYFKENFGFKVSHSRLFSNIKRGPINLTDSKNKTTKKSNL
ncbi:MAG TPA: DUF2971 domain-containing protein [Salinivirgaceae bacterium]|nr:DUF2971 domain-containing protein [Salinivirgaceae bacterium]